MTKMKLRRIHISSCQACLLSYCLDRCILVSHTDFATKALDFPSPILAPRIYLPKTCLTVYRSVNDDAFEARKNRPEETMKN